MTLEQFRNAFEIIKKYNDDEKENQKLLKESPIEYGKYQILCISFIKECMNVPEEEDIIEWFIYDINFGEECKEKTTIEELYNYLVENYGKVK